MSKTTHAKLVIIGSGPAGYTAAIYAARAMLDPILIQGIETGGQLTTTTDVENYPGFADVIQGPWLMEQMQKQAAHVGTKMVADHVNSVDLGAPSVPDRLRFRRRLPGRRAGARDRRPGALARSAVGAEIPRLRRFRLRHLRRVFLSRQGSAGDRRRQYRGRRSAVSDQLRQQGHRRPPARQFPRRAHPSGAALPESENLGAVEHRAGRRDRR